MIIDNRIRSYILSIFHTVKKIVHLTPVKISIILRTHSINLECIFSQLFITHICKRVKVFFPRINV